MDALKTLEQSEICLNNGYLELARDLVYSLPERLYDRIFAWSRNDHLGYRYYLSRYVLDSVEPQSVYTDKSGTKQDIEKYKLNLVLIRTIPADVMSTPFKPIQARHTRDKSKTLAMSFS